MGEQGTQIQVCWWPSPCLVPGRAPSQRGSHSLVQPTAGTLRNAGGWGAAGGHLQEEVLHEVVVVGRAAVWEEAGSKDDDGTETFAIVPCGEAASERPGRDGPSPR